MITHSIMDTTTDSEIARELGARLRAYRLQQNMAVAEVAARAGVHRNTVLKAEAGANPRIETVIAILRALGRIDALDAFLPPPQVSPLALVKTAGKPRQRARRSARG